MLPASQIQASSATAAVATPSHTARNQRRSSSGFGASRSAIHSA